MIAGKSAKIEVSLRWTTEIITCVCYLGGFEIAQIYWDEDTSCYAAQFTARRADRGAMRALSFETVELAKLWVEGVVCANV